MLIIARSLAQKLPMAWKKIMLLKPVTASPW
jgi:hypothetical protein